MLPHSIEVNEASSYVSAGFAASLGSKYGWGAFSIFVFLTISTRIPVAAVGAPAARLHDTHVA